LSEHAPRRFARWTEIAQAGSAAASKRDEAALRQSCKDCHNEYRTRFRKEHRGLLLF
jgi:cytochrome c556